MPSRGVYVCVGVKVYAWYARTLYSLPLVTQ